MAALAILLAGAIPPASAAGTARGEELPRNDRWSEGTAQLLPRGRWESSVLGPVRWGVHDGVEVSTQPVLDLLRMPNAAAKIAWGAAEGWRFATRHEVSWPTPLLRSIAHPGAYGILPGDARIPGILSFRHEAIATVRNDPDDRFTVAAGVRHSFRNGDMSMPTIDLPIVFPRTADYHHGPVLQARALLERRLRGDVWLVSQATLFRIRDPRAPFHFEQRGMLAWRGSRRFAAEAGVLYVHGRYPFGTQQHLMPWIDLQLGFGG